jgi:hypothetical protein
LLRRHIDGKHFHDADSRWYGAWYFQCQHSSRLAARRYIHRSQQRHHAGKYHEAHQKLAWERTAISAAVARIRPQGSGSRSPPFR